eukprot:COSAG05_NODE_3401_length_2085_cov_2.908862_3_plen_229_part_01
MTNIRFLVKRAREKLRDKDSVAHDTILTRYSSAAFSKTMHSVSAAGSFLEDEVHLSPVAQLNCNLLLSDTTTAIGKQIADFPSEFHRQKNQVLKNDTDPLDLLRSTRSLLNSLAQAILQDCGDTLGSSNVPQVIESSLQTKILVPLYAPILALLRPASATKEDRLRKLRELLDGKSQQYFDIPKTMVSPSDWAAAKESFRRMGASSWATQSGTSTKLKTPKALFTCLLK